MKYTCIKADKPARVVCGKQSLCRQNIADKDVLCACGLKLAHQNDLC
jgi:hypothetical protein